MNITYNDSGDLPQSLSATEFTKEFNALKDIQAKNNEIYKKQTFSDDETAVEINNFSFSYGEGPLVLNDISIRIPKNKIVAIIGPSGCGKSTLLRSINRMNDEMGITKAVGEIVIDGENILSKDTELLQLRTKVGMVFQKPQPFPRSIRNNITFGPKLHGINAQDQLDEIVEKSLKGAGLWDEVHDRLDDHAYGLSGGQQQRLCIARTIAVKPSIILFDEPASALDPKSTYQIEDLLLELKEQYTVLIVTHNMQQAARISDYCIFMYHGNVIEYGLTSEVFEKPFYTLTENYISGRFG
ncbi:MAG: phosphate ABC transporter ATP-binding protein [Candidatus Heimdallarchaeota archaeon]|nr:phosphate ABC transporter ATP-binding protein [Candidatus Heimdallarchaeota archaeon]